MRRAFYFFTIGLMLVFGTLKSQNIPATSLSFHSALEEQAIKEFMENKEGNMFALQMISAHDLSATELSDYSTRLDEFVVKLSEKRQKYKNDEKFLSYIFYKINQKFLKRYKPFTSPAMLFKTGEYDCLSGTTMYALILDRLDIDHDIVETNHHIYLRIERAGKVYLMESTDPMYGFIADQKEVANRLNDYDYEAGAGIPRESVDKDVYVFRNQVNETIDMYDLVGLHYYNAAVNSFNQEDISTSINNLEKAVVFYFSPRISEFGLLVGKTLLQVNHIQGEDKRDYLNRINHLLSVERTYAVR
ncbi:hypothetical protein LVD17_09695 [Fulvivirga ulvae]|uniref:hypothetical protein n=1 Tax=Fulvivirga ulvae TaxID=2904245 RepID=UPI001F472489|nr:hypothetical protein [Fulvivirga ulvae]UII34086.1 hypothetical protein LVD17_09695 [Fulvivirga ulvae]